MAVKLLFHGVFLQSMIKIEDFHYPLPEERIAKFPLAERDHSKLLVFSKSGTIKHTQFTHLVEEIPENTLMIFNNTKVIPARIHFQKESGASIELFLLNPEKPTRLLQEAMQLTSLCSWHCSIGNLKRWKSGTVLHKDLGFTQLEARLIDRVLNLVEFTWTNNFPFAEVVDKAGLTPLPPYLKRKAEPSDKLRYQTIYSEHKGAVAAPTAGLHFTPRVVNELRTKGVKEDFVTLHVSAGTFLPVKSDNALEHIMHTEQIVVNLSTLQQLERHKGPIVAVGTTSMRTLESLYWMGIQLLQNKEEPFLVTQHTPTMNEPAFTTKESIQALIEFILSKKESFLIGHTSIYIYPGFRFRFCSGLITNFHQPSSTLMLLVASFVGEDWKRIYQEALDKGYRFLSYGDSSLLWKKEQEA